MLALDTRIIWEDPCVRIRIPPEALSFAFTPHIVNDGCESFVELFHGEKGALHTYIHGESLNRFLEQCKSESWETLYSTRGNRFGSEDVVRGTVLRLLPLLEKLTFRVSLREKCNKPHRYVVLHEVSAKRKKRTSLPLLTYWPQGEVVLSTPELKFEQDESCLVVLTTDRSHAVIRTESLLYNTCLYVLLDNGVNTYRYLKYEEAKGFVNGSTQPVRI